MSKTRRTRTARLRAEATAIGRRLERAVRPNMTGPVLGRANIAYELSARTKATGHGGIGMGRATPCARAGAPVRVPAADPHPELEGPHVLPRVSGRQLPAHRPAVRRPRR